MRIKSDRNATRWAVAVALQLMLMVAPLAAQQPKPKSPPATPATQPATQSSTPAAELTFDNLLAADRYKMYAEVRNVGQLLSTGGAGEIVDPILKLADPGPQFKSIINFLKKNSELLASSRLMFAFWRVRTDVP